MSDERMNVFLRFSVEVTAFSIVELRGTGNAESFSSTVDEIVGAETLNALLEAYEAIDDPPGPERRRRLRQEIFGDEKLGPIARNIIKMWFVGIWYQLPRTWRQRYGARTKDVTFTVSPNAYTQGLLWPNVGANPAGAKAPGYASWTGPPRIPRIPREERGRR